MSPWAQLHGLGIFKVKVQSNMIGKVPKVPYELTYHMIPSHLGPEGGSEVR